MKKFIKTYIPYLILVLFTFVVGALFKLNLVINKLYMSKEIAIYNIILFSISIILLLALAIEIIVCAINCTRNKEVKKVGLWTVLIYIFNIFIIPYYNLKYIIKASKIKLKMIILVILTIISFIGGFIVSNYIIDKYNYYSLENVSTKIYNTSDDMITIKVPKSYTKENEESWNLYFYDYDRGLELAITSIDLKQYKVTPSDAIDVLALNLNSPKLLDTKESKFDDKKVYTKTYSSEYEGISLQYTISAIEFNDNPEYLICVVEVSSLKEADYYEEEFKQILHSITLDK